MKYRNIYMLIEEIKKHVPKIEKGFHAALDDVIDSANYRAPEAYVVNFDQLARVLELNLPSPDKLVHDWQRTVVGLFSDEIKIKNIKYFEWNL